MKEKLTQKDVEKIQQEIDHRKLVVRKEAIEAVKEARAQGDLSENFEYYAAKKHKNQNESRIRYLENMLKTATIVSDDSKDDEVGMDDIVEVYFEEDDEIEKYKLVTSIRGNSMENRISIESPIGMALKGHKVGDRVEVKVNDNYSYFLEIRSIDKAGSLNIPPSRPPLTAVCFPPAEAVRLPRTPPCSASGRRFPAPSPSPSGGRPPHPPPRKWR